MCGIVGFIGNYKKFSKTDLVKMNNTIHHRGPDDEGYYIDDVAKVALAHKRLSILDLSTTGHQPMFSQSKRFVIVYNGETYNFNDIKIELEKEKKYNWSGHSDTEIILEAIEYYGIEESLKKFNGMFAFTVFDKLNNIVYLARDRYGKKPLYYTIENNVLIFASELKALKQHSLINTSINKEAIDLYFQLGYIPTPYSIYENIYKLESSSYIKVDLNNINNFEIKKYYKVNTVTSSIYDKEEALKKLEFLLEDSVQKRMLSDVSIGSFLSAGIDSSIVTSIMQKYSSQKINTYTVGFDTKEYNEAPRAKEIAKYLGTNHNEMYLTQQDVLDIIPKLIEVYDEPFSDFSALPTMLVTQFASQDVKVMLSGDGGDELFAGYTRYSLANDSWNKINSSLFYRYLYKVGCSMPMSIYDNKIFEKLISSYTNRTGFVGDKISKLCNSISLEKGFLSSYYLLNSVWKDESIVRNFKSSNFISNIILDIEKMDLNNYESMMQFDRKLYLIDNNLLKVDRASMSNSLEVRSPLLDYRLFEFSNTLDTSMKIKNKKGKLILKDLMSKYIPSELMDMPKTGFSVPMANWLRNELKDWGYEILVYGKENYADILDFDLIFKYWDEHQMMKRNYPQQLWSVIVMIEWFKND